MGKKLLLVVGTLSVLVVGLVIYRHHIETDFHPPAVDIGAPPPPEGGDETVGGIRVGDPEGIWHAQTDPVTGRRLAVFRCARWRTGDPHVLTEPDIEVYPLSGETIYIRAKQATVHADEAAGQPVLRRGRLTGDVEIVVDLNRDREAQRIDLDQRPDDRLVARTDEVHFDLDLQELHAPGAVTVDAEGMHIGGEDFEVQWHSAPEVELRRLRLARAGTMRVDTGGPLFGRRPRATADDGASPAREPTAGPAAEQETSGADLRAYGVVLTEDVEVSAGARMMTGCDRLEVIFSARQDADWDRRGAGASEPAVRPIAPEAAPATEPPAQADPERETVLITWTGPLVMVPFDPAATGRPAPPANEFILTAEGDELRLAETTDDGPMTARCGSLTYASGSRTARLAAPESDHGQVELTLANGDRILGQIVRIEQDDDALVVHMDGPGLMTVGPAVAVDAASQAGAGRAEPAAMQPAGLAAEGGRIDWTDRVRMQFDPSPDDRGRLIPAEAVFVGSVSFLGGDGSSVAADTMTVLFEQPAPSAAVTGETGGVGLPRIARVETAGAVRFDVGAGGDTVRADALDVDLATTADGRYYPAEAVAAGNVEAVFDGSDIRAAHLKVAMAPVADSHADRPAKPVAVTAIGDVVLTDRSAEQTVQAMGARMDGDLVAGTFRLTGTPAVDGGEPAPARMAYGDQWLAGTDILLVVTEVVEDGRTRRVLRQAVVEGAGVAKILMERDLAGADLSEPGPAIIRWADRMAYTPEDNRLTFGGNVALDTAMGGELSEAEPVPFDSVGDHLRCDELTIFVEAADETREPATQPGEGLLDVRRQVRGVQATGNVRLLSRRHDDGGYLLSRVQMVADALEWNVAAATFTVPGPGTLSLEDYRSPQSADGAGDPFAPDSLDRPGITALQWTRRMQLVQSLWQAEAADRAGRPEVWVATMDGGVMMRHRSGANIDGLDALPIRRPEPMGRGRIAELDCRHLLARFSADRGNGDPGGIAAPPGAGALTLELFEAVGGVVFRDGPYEAQGGRIVYDREEQVAVVYGAESADAAAPPSALVAYEDPASGRGFNTVSPVITVLRVGDAYRVTAVKAAAAGAR